MNEQTADAHRTTTVQVPQDGGSFKFEVHCSCGWSSPQYSASGVAAGASAQHIDEAAQRH
ncbi:MAG: hypothetical protein V7636_1351 [Actinomycetota bacterium]|jgi:hypothetical protein